jgi:hypothetical protein
MAPLLEADLANGYWGPATSTLDWCEKNYEVNVNLNINVNVNVIYFLLSFLMLPLLRGVSLSDTLMSIFHMDTHII